MNTMTANELKTKGFSALEARLKADEEVIISVRGRDRFVVMDIEKYAQLREYELTVALQEAKADVEAGRYNTESVAEVLNQYQKTLELLEIDPHHPSLRLHRLQGRLSGLSSASINMSYRIVLEMVIRDRDIILVDVGSHDQEY